MDLSAHVEAINREKLRSELTTFPFDDIFQINYSQHSSVCNSPLCGGRKGERERRASGVSGESGDEQGREGREGDPSNTRY